MNTEQLTVAVFTPMEYLARIKLSFTAASSKFEEICRFGAVVKYASNVDDFILMAASPVHTDYVVIFVNTCEGNSITKCKQHLERMDPHFANTRMCIVNGSCRSAGITVAERLTQLADELRIPIVNAQMDDDVSCKLVAEKLLKLASVSSGLQFGIPVVIPTVHDINISH